MKVLCRHCQNPCKRIGLVECDKYNAKANRPQQIEVEIKKAYASRDFELANKLRKELDAFWYGANK